MKKREDVLTVGVFFALVMLVIFMIYKIPTGATNTVEVNNTNVTVDDVIESNVN